MKKYFAMLAFLLMATGAFAQVEGSSVYLGTAMPRRAYGAGLSVGYKYQYNLPVEGLGLIGSVDLYYSRLNKDVRNSNEKSFDTWLDLNNYKTDNVTAKRFASNHVAIPINFGANYTYPLGRMNVWGEGAIGCAPIFTSRQVWKAKKYSSVEYDSTTGSGRPTTVHDSGWRHHYDITKIRPGVGFSWKVALGAMLDQKYSLGLYVDGVSKYKQKTQHVEDVKPYWNTNNGSYNRETKGENENKGYACVSIRFGYHF